MSWAPALLAVPVILAALALSTGGLPFKLGGAASCALILLAALPCILGPRADALAVVAALLASVIGDYFLSTRAASEARFLAGIGAFLLAHLGYLSYALMNGRPSWIVLAVLLAAYLAYYFLVLRRRIRSQALAAAALAYLVVSCVALAAAAGLDRPPAVRWLYTGGIALIVISDTFISLEEFVHYRGLSPLILPTYYAAHVAITLSLLLG